MGGTGRLPLLSGTITGYSAYQLAATAGAQAYGLILPTGQTWQTAAIEVQAASGQPTPVDVYEVLEVNNTTSLITPTFTPSGR